MFFKSGRPRCIWYNFADTIFVLLNFARLTSIVSRKTVTCVNFKILFGFFFSPLQHQFFCITLFYVLCVSMCLSKISSLLGICLRMNEASYLLLSTSSSNSRRIFLLLLGFFLLACLLCLIWYWLISSWSIPDAVPDNRLRRLWRHFGHGCRRQCWREE